jgi:hypothetical protein
MKTFCVVINQQYYCCRVWSAKNHVDSSLNVQEKKPCLLKFLHSQLPTDNNNK